MNHLSKINFRYRLFILKVFNPTKSIIKLLAIQINNKEQQP